MLAYRDKHATVQQIGRELNASYVLEGSLRRVGNRLRLNAQLVDTRSGRGVWAERYDRQLEDVFAIQDEIVQSIARALEVMLTEKEKRAIEKAPTADVQAYDYYLRGRSYTRRWDLDFALQMFGSSSRRRASADAVGWQLRGAWEEGGRGPPTENCRRTATRRLQRVVQRRLHLCTASEERGSPGHAKKGDQRGLEQLGMGHARS